MLKLYLAAAWENREAIIGYKKQLEDAGYIVTSTWMLQESTDDPVLLREHALRDLEQLLAANILVLINSQKRGQETSGKAVETGVAIATLKGIILVGERSNIFHYLKIPVVASLEEAIEELKNWEAVTYSHPAWGEMESAALKVRA